MFDVKVVDGLQWDEEVGIGVAVTMTSIHRTLRKHIYLSSPHSPSYFTLDTP